MPTVAFVMDLWIHIDVRASAGSDGRCFLIRGEIVPFEPSEPPDVVISDHVDYLTSDYGTNYALSDARRRLSKCQRNVLRSRTKLPFGMFSRKTLPHMLGELFV